MTVTAASPEGQNDRKAPGPPGSPSSKSVSFACPHCRSPAKVRSSKPVTPLVKDFWLHCQNVMCGATFKGQIELVAEISPPAVRNPRIRLRSAAQPFTADMIAPAELKRPHRALPKPANDIAANDDMGGAGLG